MSWTKILRGMAAAGIAGVGGCAVGPDYHPPAAACSGRLELRRWQTG